MLNLNLSKLSFKELRKIATAISVIGYTQYSSFYSLNYDERNENRKLETDAQNKFVDYVFNKQYKKAYEMIEKEVNLYKN